MKVHKALWRVLCWTGVIILLNATLTTCFSYEPKVENEPEEADTTTAKAMVDSVPMPIFKQDSLATTAVEDTATALIPTELAFSDSALADTLYAGEKRQEQPFYKKWWFIAIVVGAVTATVIAIASGDQDEAKEDLPGFPDPPDK
jgi:hypothetical protein